MKKMYKSIALASICFWSSAFSQNFSTTGINEFNETVTVYPPVPVPPPITDKSSLDKAYNQIEDRFTDSQGRTTLYRIAIPAGLDLSVPQPVVMYFHGNNSGSQETLMNDFFGFLKYKGLNRNMIFVMPVSPGTTMTTQGERRHWHYRVDNQLIHEFINLELPKHFKMDKRRVYFSGASQGTCFMNQFIPRKGEGYAGGFFAGCGCHNFRDSSWTPSRDLVDNLKIYVSSSSGDFLLPPSERGADFYESEGFEVKRDLYDAGGHCALVWSQMDKALDWFETFPRVPAPNSGSVLPFQSSFE